MSKKLSFLTIIVLLGLTALYFSPYYYFSTEQKAARQVAKLVDRNIEARGGEKKWEAVSSLQLQGRMDVGQGMNLPYTLEQKRPGKMRLEFVFDGETAIQAFDGTTGWKLLPFLGRRNPEPMSKKELRLAADTSELYGLLYDYKTRGHKIELLGKEKVADTDTFKLKVTLSSGDVRWVYLDSETALEVKVEALRQLAGHQRLVTTFYQDWQAADGLLIANRQETRTEGDKESHFLTIESVEINPQIDDNRFTMPSLGMAVARQGK